MWPLFPEKEKQDAVIKSVHPHLHSLNMATPLKQKINPFNMDKWTHPHKLACAYTGMQTKQQQNKECRRKLEGDVYKHNIADIQWSDIQQVIIMITKSYTPKSNILPYISH